MLNLWIIINCPSKSIARTAVNANIYISPHKRPNTRVEREISSFIQWSVSAFVICPCNILHRVIFKRKKLRVICKHFALPVLYLQKLVQSFFKASLLKPPVVIVYFKKLCYSAHYYASPEIVHNGKRCYAYP